MVERAPSQFSRTPYNLQFAKIGGAWAGAGLLAPTLASVLGLPQFLQRQYLLAVVQWLAFKAPGSG